MESTARQTLGVIREEAAELGAFELVERPHSGREMGESSRGASPVSTRHDDASEARMHDYAADDGAAAMQYDVPIPKENIIGSHSDSAAVSPDDYDLWAAPSKHSVLPELQKTPEKIVYVNTLAQCFPDYGFLGVGTRRPHGLELPSPVWAAAVHMTNTLPLVEMMLSADGVTFLSCAEVLATARPLPWCKLGNSQYKGASCVVGRMLFEPFDGHPNSYRIVDMGTGEEWAVAEMVTGLYSMSSVGFYHEDKPMFAVLFYHKESAELHLIQKESIEVVILNDLPSKCIMLDHVCAEGRNYIVLGLDRGVALLDVVSRAIVAYADFEMKNEKVKACSTFRIPWNKDLIKKDFSDLKRLFAERQKDGVISFDINPAEIFELNEAMGSLDVGGFTLTNKAESFAVSPDLRFAAIGLLDRVLVVPLAFPPEFELPPKTTTLAGPLESELCDTVAVRLYNTHMLIVAKSGEMNVCEFDAMQTYTSVYRLKRITDAPPFIGHFPMQWVLPIGPYHTAVFSPHCGTRILERMAVADIPEDAVITYRQSQPIEFDKSKPGPQVALEKNISDYYAHMRASAASVGARDMRTARSNADLVGMMGSTAREGAKGPADPSDPGEDRFGKAYEKKHEKTKKHNKKRHK